MNVLSIYNLLPVWIQNIAVSVMGYKIQKERYGKLFDEKYSLSINRDKYTEDKLKEYRDQKIREIVEYSYTHVLFYRKLFDENKIDYKSIKGLNDLQKIPIIDKTIVQKYHDEFYSDEFRMKKNSIRHVHTSGTTGAGLNLNVTKEADAENWAITWREHEKLGIKREMLCGYFAGRPIVPAKQKTPPFYRINRPGKQLMFSSFHMSDDNLYSYVDTLNKYKPIWIHGYPSVISLLADFINRTGYGLRYNVKVITLCSENVTEKHIQTIEKAFGIRPNQTYGQTEGVGCFRDYVPGKIKVIEDYSAVEFVKMEDGETHIVGTNFNNKAMPLIRYDTHDIAQCVDTPFERRVVNIDGRLEDYVKLIDGSRIGRLDHIFKDAEHVKEAQIVQKSLEYVIIRIVKLEGYTIDDEHRIRDLMDDRFGKRLKYDIEYVNCIPRTKNGKMRFVVSEVNE